MEKDKSNWSPLSILAGILIFLFIIVVLTWLIKGKDCFSISSPKNPN